MDMGFRPDIDAIKKFLPSTPDRQTFLFSATLPAAIRQLAKGLLDPNHQYINCIPADARHLFDSRLAVTGNSCFGKL